MSGFEVAIEPENKQILGLSISKEKNMFAVTERFISKSSDDFVGHHPVSTDDGTWCPQACRFLKL